MGEAAQCGAFDRGRFRCEGIDLDDPAEVVRLVAIVACSLGGQAGGVEALEFVAGQVIPTVAAGAADTVPGHFTRALGIATGEITSPVFLAGQVGAPGREAVGAVVQRAAGGGAVGAVASLEQGVTACWAADLHRCGARDAAVAGAGQHLPLATHAAHFYYRNAVGVDFLAHFIGAAALAADQGGAIGVQQRRVDVLVVEYQQAVVALVTAAALTVDGEEVHAVMVHADLVSLIGGTVAGVVEECREAATNRRAPGDEGGGFVAGWHGDGIGTGNRHRIERQALAAFLQTFQQLLELVFERVVRGLGTAGHGDAEKAHDAERSAAGDHLAAAQAGFDQVIDMGIAGGVAERFIAIAE